MALLDSIIGGLLGGGQQSSGLGSILGGLLGGGGAAAGGGSGGLLSGGLGGLIQRMEQAGLGNVAQSWVQHGDNQSVSPQELGKVFHPHELDQMSQQSGLSQGDILSQLSQYLPGAVDKMTPNGQFAGSADPFSTEATGNPRI